MILFYFARLFSDVFNKNINNYYIFHSHSQKIHDLLNSRRAVFSLAAGITAPEIAVTTLEKK